MKALSASEGSPTQKRVVIVDLNFSFLNRQLPREERRLQGSQLQSQVGGELVAWLAKSLVTVIILHPLKGATRILT